MKFIFTKTPTAEKNLFKMSDSDSNIDSETSFLRVWKEFLGYTTAHGFGRYVEAGNSFGKFIWIVFLVGTYAGFSWHLSTLVTRFLQKPLLTVYDNRFEYQFPDVYVCPRNPVSISRLVSKLTDADSLFLRQNVELSRDRFINLFNKTSNSPTDSQVRKLLDFDIWAGNVTLSQEFVEIADVLQNVEQQIMAILMTADEVAKPKHDTELCYSMVDKGINSYKGTLSVTANGHQCKKWTARYPTEHAEGHTYCRNPDNKRAPWCFTENPHIQWEYCNVPICPDSVSNLTCYNRDDLGKNSYKGTKSTTKSGYNCQMWNTTTPHNHTEIVTNSSNYCRNPDSTSSGPWCFTTNSTVRRETCAVPECPRFEKNCYRKEYNGQTDYEGKISTTVSGLTCQDWRVNTPHVNKYAYAAARNPHNYCRNPGGDKLTLWCYTTDPDVKWEPCAVPQCSDENIKLITSIIHNRLGDLLLHMFGNDLYFNLIKCSIGEEKCKAADFNTFAHPAFGICHKLNATRFIAGKNVKEIVLMPIKMELYADATDIRGQEYELPSVKSLELSMYPIGSSSSTKGYDIYIMSPNEYLHNIPPVFRSNKIKVQSNTHTHVHIGFNKREKFPDGTCIEAENEKNISYVVHEWKSFLFDQFNVTASGATKKSGNISDTNHWKEQLDMLEIMYTSKVGSKYKFAEFANTKYDCMNTALIKNFLDNCNCVPAIMPTPAMYADKSKYPHCLDGNFDLVKRARCYQKQLDDLNIATEHVRHECAARCNVAKYDISYYSVPWPMNNMQDVRSALKDISKHFDYPHSFNKWRGISGLFYAYMMSEHLLNLKEGGELEHQSSDEYLTYNKMFQGISSNLAKVNIEATGAYGDRVYSEEAYPIKNLFADLGGLLGLWSGISVLTICEILELIIYFIMVIHNRRLVGKTKVSIDIKTYENNGYNDNIRTNSKL